MGDFLDWLARAGGFLAMALGIAGFVFREKWKQILARSLATDLERLKSELTRSQAEHAASLTPQLESIKHDFQQKLEAYKVSLIAEAEGAKARSELRKAVALKYAEVEFDRLIALEEVLGPLYASVIGRLGVEPAMKDAQDVNMLRTALKSLDTACKLCEVFSPLEDQRELLEFRMAIHNLIVSHAGPGAPKLDPNSPEAKKTLALAASTHRKLKNRIRALGAI